MKIFCGLCCVLCFTFLGFDEQIGDGNTMTQTTGQDDCTQACSPSACAMSTPTQKAATCLTTPSCSAPVVATELGDLENKAVQYICDVIVKEKRVSFDQDEVEKAIGGTLSNVDPGKIQGAVMAELQRRNFDLASLPANRCTTYNACSINMDLSHAKGPELERYQQEKKRDGVWTYPYLAEDFTLESTSGNKVKLSGYEGKPVAVVFLAVHCSHSWDTLPILDELTKEFGDKLVILPVFTNSGSVEDVKESTSHKNLQLDYLVAEGKTLSQKYDSLIVPTVFLINREGNITKRLVGFKNKDDLKEDFVALASRNMAAQ